MPVAEVSVADQVALEAAQEEVLEVVALAVASEGAASEEAEHQEDGSFFKNKSGYHVIRNNDVFKFVGH